MKGLVSFKGQGQDELQRETDSAVTSCRQEKKLEGKARSLIAWLEKQLFGW